MPCLLRYIDLVKISFFVQKSLKIFSTGSDSSFSLDASPSYDPDRDSTATESFNWECYDQQTSPCLVPHVNDSSKMVRLVLAAAKKVTIERGTLSSNET